jgi:hypothetical protein
VAVAVVLGEWSQVWGSAVQLLINLLGIVLAGAATLTLRRWGAGRRARRETRPTRPQWQRRAFRA